MNIKRAMTSCFLLASLTGAVAAHAEDRDADRAHPANWVKDSVVTTKVKAKLAHSHMRSLAHVHVDTDNAGVVTLTGNVRTQHEADVAGDLARHTEHVTSVTNQLVIKKDD